MNDVLAPKTLGVFFTYGVSVSLWKKQGMLAREISLYRALRGNPFEKIYFFTYALEDADLLAQLKEMKIVVCAKKSRMPNFLYSFLLPFLYKTQLRDCSVYKTTQMFGSWTAVLAKWMYKKPLFVRAGFALSTNLRGQGWGKRMLARGVEYLALKNADQVLVTTDTIKNLYEKFTNRITVIPNFVDTKLFVPSDEMLGGKIRILFVGRLSYEKNIANLILAVKNKANFQLNIIGVGPERVKLEALARGAAATIHFLGSVAYKKLPEYFAAADIFVLPSLFEGHPKVLVEAMAAGLPIVGTRVRGIETLIEDHVTGILVGTRSDEIRRGIEEIVEDAVLRENLKRNARVYAEEHFGFEKIVELEREVYRKVLC